MCTSVQHGSLSPSSTLTIPTVEDDLRPPRTVLGNGNRTVEGDNAGDVVAERSGVAFRLVPLKTTLETRVRESLMDVYVTRVPVKKASVCLDVIRKLAPNDGGLDLQHLRRFAKDGDVPSSVREAFALLESVETVTDLVTGLDDVQETQPIAPKSTAELLLIVGSTGVLPQQAVLDALSKIVTNPMLLVLPVPLLSPTTTEQAKLWSTKYWPTVYKKSNPFGPHVSLMSRTADEIHDGCQKWMDLAAAAARESKVSGHGEAIGVVVVERRNGVARAIAVAGDARWKNWPYNGGPGNVTAHAAMRAIGMVAEGLREREFRKGLEKSLSTHVEPEIFQDSPLSAVERDSYDTSDNESGYLCFDLEIYCTHEPCVMCSMAIIHSRFGRLVFNKRMTRTGGICAEEDGLGCGLWWRKELNWTMLAWHYTTDDESDADTTDPNLHA